MRPFVMVPACAGRYGGPARFFMWQLNPAVWASFSNTLTLLFFPGPIWSHQRFTDELADKMHSGCERLAGDAPIDELERGA